MSGSQPVLCTLPLSTLMQTDILQLKSEAQCCLVAVPVYAHSLLGFPELVCCEACGAPLRSTHSQHRDTSQEKKWLFC